MDDLAVGRLILLARQRKQWRQTDLAGVIGVSQQLVALAETGASKGSHCGRSDESPRRSASGCF